MNKPDVKKLVLLNLPYVFAFYFADKIAAVFRLAPGTEFIDKLTNGFAVFGTAFANPLPSFHPVDLLIGLSAGVLPAGGLRQRQEPQEVPAGRRIRICPLGQAGGHQAVHESGVLEQCHPNADGVPDHEQPPEAAEVRQKQNILVIGGSGSGKTRFLSNPI